MIFILVLSFFTISYFMGMMVHSSLMYEDKKSIGKDSRIGWVLSMLVGTGITAVSYTHLTLPTNREV